MKFPWKEIVPAILGLALLGYVMSIVPREAYAGPIQEEILRVAPTYLGVREELGPNHGKRVDKILANAGLPPGQPWCMALVYTINKEAHDNLKLSNPVPRTGLSAGYWRTAIKRKFTFKVIPASQVLLGAKIEPADTAIWRRGAIRADGTFSGHAATVITQVNSKTFKSIDGNTGADEKGDQGEGDGSFLKTRRLGVSKFLVMGFIRIR
ncbi:MAG: hypothetical protein PHY48_15140 [Candidatus Cloacimonetes bacterium]|nr:hypothetical protein [Candidatus Cloacimonadota bacterium]